MSLTGQAALNSPTFRAIEKRLASFDPPIRLRDHIVENPTTVKDLEVHPLILQGVDFAAKDPDKFVEAIRKARNGAEMAFTEGSTKPSDWKQHWAMSTSLLATKGIGFREPWRYFLNDSDERLARARPFDRNAPAMLGGISERFGTANPVNLSALHVAVAYGKWTECNIHVDETGIAMWDLQNNVTITPNVINHFVNELLFKSILGEHLPTWFVDRVNLHVLSPEMNYRRLGVGVDVMKGKTYKLTLTASCGLKECADIDVSRILSLDLDAIKKINPTISYEKRF